MTKRITVVIDVGDPSAADYHKDVWNIDQLLAQLTAADKAVQASVFVGKLEDAPESWAYVLCISDADLQERAKVPAMKLRLARTLGTHLGYLMAGRIAELYGMLGAMDVSARNASAKDPGVLFVKKAIATKLKWPVWDHEETDVVVRTTEAAKLPLAKLVVTYLDAALEQPAER